MMETTAQQSSILPGEGRPVRVDVFAELEPSGEVKFRLDSELIEGDDDGGLIFDQDRDDMRKRDHYLVDFVLNDRTGLGLTFASSKEDAFWIDTAPIDEPHPPCPLAPSYEEEIHAIAVSDDKLTIRNENNTKVNFAYSLGFVTRDGKPVRLDPVGSNKDGGA